MAFCDVFGKQRNISIMPDELEKAFRYGVAIDGSAVAGFGCDIHSDLILHPDPSTLSILPWRPEHGRVVRMFCNITNPDGTPFESDARSFLGKAIKAAEDEGIRFAFGSEMEFYLFKRNEQGNPTGIPYDNAGYMDIAPEDKGENIRREVCLTLEQMGIYPVSSHHEEGPGQNEINFKYSAPMQAADDAVTFKSVVNTISARNGLYSDFSPKPIKDCAGNGMHINISAVKKDGESVMQYVVAGILKHMREMNVFFNPTAESYKRLGNHKAPAYVSWSKENRSQLIRIPAHEEGNPRAELRSPDSTCNPYLAYAMIIYAGLDGVKNSLPIPEAKDVNLFDATPEVASGLEKLPGSLEEAKALALESAFVRKTVPAGIMKAFLG